MKRIVATTSDTNAMSEQPDAVLCSDPNQHMLRAGLQLTPGSANVSGYQEYFIDRYTVRVSDRNPYIRRKFEVVTQALTSRMVAGRTVLDLGANGGLFTFWSLQHGAERAYCVDLDPEYTDIIERVAQHLGFSGVETFTTNVDTWETPADVVLALALVHWIYSCTALYGSLEQIIERLALLTGYALIIEWVEPTDPAVDFFHHLDWNPAYARGEFTLAAFEAALAKHFARVEVIGDLSDTRRIYAAFTTEQEVALFGSLPLLYEKASLISSRWLASAHQIEYWSRVYDPPSGGMIVKQTTADLAEREFAFLSQLQPSAYFPRPYRTYTEGGFSVVELEKIDGKPLRQMTELFRNDLPAFLSFVRHSLNILAVLERTAIQHRDIHIDNVLVRHGQPVLIDFGWAVSHGSPYVIPPTLGPKEQDFSDVYSMGKVLTWLGDGRFPAIEEILGLMTTENPSLRVTDIALLRHLLRVRAEAAGIAWEYEGVVHLEDGQPEPSVAHAADEAVSALVRHLAKRDQLIVLLQGILQARNAEVQRLDDSLRLNEAHYNLPDLQKRLEEAEADRAYLRACLDDANTDRADLRAYLAEVETSWAHLHDHLNRAEAEGAHARADMEQMEAGREELASQLQLAAQERDALRQDRGALLAAYETTQAALNAKEAYILTLETHLRTFARSAPFRLVGGLRRNLRRRPYRDG